MDIQFKHNGQNISVNVGYGTIVAASEHLRKERLKDWREALEYIAKTVSAEGARDAVVESMKEYKNQQIPTEGEINWWLKTPDGILFTVVHGTKKSVKLSMEQVQDLFDYITEEEFDELVYAIDSATQGKKLAGAMKKAREVGDREDLLKLEGIIRDAEKRATEIEADEAKKKDAEQAAADAAKASMGQS